MGRSVSNLTRNDEVRGSIPRSSSIENKGLTWYTREKLVAGLGTSFNRTKEIT